MKELRGMYEPPAGGVRVRPMRAHYTERVRITWTLPDRSTFEIVVTCPTPETIAATRRTLETKA